MSGNEYSSDKRYIDESIKRLEVDTKQVKEELSQLKIDITKTMTAMETKLTTYVVIASAIVGVALPWIFEKIMG